MRFLLSILLAFFTSGIVAQNLVANPDFELTTGIYCGIAAPGDFSLTMFDWHAATAGSPDAFFTTNDPSCWNHQPTSTYTGPIGIKGSQQPRSGSVMTGIFLYTINGLNQREYIQATLNPPMIPGEQYVVECYVSLADSTESATDRLGILLSTDAVGMATDGVLPYTPQIVADQVLNSAQNWVRVFDTITASEAYDYLVIGNFYDDTQTNTSLNPTSSSQPGTYGAYYFIDDVRVEQIRGNLGVSAIESQKPPKKVVKIVDLLGRETSFNSNTLLFRMYDDGSVESFIHLSE